MKPIIIVQKEISRKMPEGSWRVPESCDLIEFSAEGVTDDVKSALRLARRTPIVNFMTIPFARRIERIYQNRLSLILRPDPMTPMGSVEEILSWPNFRFMLPAEYQINSYGLIVPVGDMSLIKGACEALGVEEVFLRPISAWKPFTGFCCRKEDLSFEVSALIQTERLRPGEMILVAPKRPLDPVEWRFYVVEQKLVTWAPYSWGEAFPLPEAPPEDIMRLARDIAERLWDIDAIVLDLGISEGRPYLIEANAVSTSGWYPGLDVEKLISALLELYI